MAAPAGEVIVSSAQQALAVIGFAVPAHWLLLLFGLGASLAQSSRRFATAIGPPATVPGASAKPATITIKTAAKPPVDAAGSSAIGPLDCTVLVLAA